MSSEVVCHADILPPSKPPSAIILAPEGCKTVTVAGCAVNVFVGHCEPLPAKMVVVIGGTVVVARQFGGWEDDSDVYAERTNVEAPDV